MPFELKAQMLDEFERRDIVGTNKSLDAVQLHRLETVRNYGRKRFGHKALLFGGIGIEGVTNLGAAVVGVPSMKATMPNYAIGLGQNDLKIDHFFIVGCQVVAVFFLLFLELVERG